MIARILTAARPWFAGFNTPLANDCLFVMIMLVCAVVGAVAAGVLL